MVYLLMFEDVGLLGIYVLAIFFFLSPMGFVRPG